MFSESSCRRWKVSRNNYSLFLQFSILAVTSFVAIKPFQEANGFHITFGHRLFKSLTNPNIVMSSSFIKPLECRNLNNQSESGVCMFSIDCMQSKGVPLSVCKHNYFVGTCCKLPNSSQLVTQTANELLPQRATSALPATTTRQQVTSHTSTSANLRSTSNSATTQSLPEHTEELSRSSSSSLNEEDRYMISSVSLFPTTSQTLQTSTIRAHLSSTTGSVESARNAEGLVSLGPQEAQKNILVVSSDSLTSLSPIITPSTSSTTKSTNLDAEHKKNEYEVIKEESSYELPTTMNSAHSLSSTQQQFNVIDHIHNQLKPMDQQHPLKQQNNIYLVDDLHQKGQQSIVFANNHQQHLSINSNTQKSPQQSVLSNGPFKPIMEQASVQEQPRSSTQKPQDEPKANSTTSTSTTVSAPSSLSSIHSSPTSHLDLVSATDQTQSTTPFTTSLSTAILPNITSHAYAPTEPPNDSVSMLVSSSHSTTATSKKPLAQLYNGQPPEMEQHPNPSRPLFGPGSLMASTKLVGSSSSSNQFMPGLAGLQSALLSHIPFKLATGLTSYLQAAMKPVGGRPLISSNTAPALQYQQNMANASKPSTPLTNIVKFPGPSPSQTQPIISSFSESTPPMQHATGNSLLISSSNSTSQYDALRETQLLCGRPQVTPADNRKRVGRIVGGNQSMFGQWPWMVSLRQWRKGAFLHKCGAALLNEKWAITAAHCVESVTPPTNVHDTNFDSTTTPSSSSSFPTNSVKASDLLLRLGEFDVSNQEEPYPYIERRVKTVVAHPSFDPKTFEYDLALLKFAEPVKYERNIVPVCVPSGNDSYIDRMATVIGWGRLYEDGPLPDVIQHVDVPIITNKECEKMYKNAGYIEEIPEMFICAGISKGGRDSCEGDSGGPLTMVDHDGRSYLVGIISWGIGCALPSQPGVYTRITAFSGWINQIIDF